MPEKAVEYHKQSGINCATAVLKGFQDRREVCPHKIEESKGWGGGKAPEGNCGALHAAKQLLDADAIATLEDDFVAQAGSVKCSDIRSLKKLSCPACVRLAAKHVAGEK